MEPMEIEWISKTFIQQVKDGETRSKIMRVATVLSAEDDDPEDAYWSLIGFYMDPDNQGDLNELYDDISVDEVFDVLIQGDGK
jgi:hypothetical protein